MACGTGKTLTSLRIAEAMCAQPGSTKLVLFLVPSIALLGQAYNAWAADTTDHAPLYAIGVCSDPHATEKRRKSKKDNVFDQTFDNLCDVPLSASTNPDRVAQQLLAYDNAPSDFKEERMCVVFSTYQSIEVVEAAQKIVLEKTQNRFGHFEICFCDEAHRTTQACAKAEDTPSFVHVHDESIIHIKKRLYMTATPRVYSESAKSSAKAKNSDVLIASMDDVSVFGPEIHRISFNDAVQKGLLTDYKVIVLTASPKDLPESIHRRIDDPNANEIDTDIATKLYGTTLALSKQITGDEGKTWQDDPQTCHRALLFANVIGDDEITGSSKNVANIFESISDAVIAAHAKDHIVHVECEHVDGSMGANERYRLLEWLDADLTDLSHPLCQASPAISPSLSMNGERSGENGHLPLAIYGTDLSHPLCQASPAISPSLSINGERSGENAVGRGPICRVLTNVRCLSEGVDVPALDAVIFLAPRKSQIDVVQSVGRVMRNFKRGEEGGKKYGYIIIPVVIPNDMAVEKALEDNERFKNVWQVLNALRSHDDHFNAIVNQISLNDEPPRKIVVGSGFIPDDGIDAEAAYKTPKTKASQQQKLEILHKQLELFKPIQDKIYAKLVEKCGDRQYWQNWVKDIAQIALNIKQHIELLLDRNENANIQFNQFMEGLHVNINDSLTRDDGIEFLAQHIVSGPIFDALFEDYHFSQNNAVSRTMQAMVDFLNAHGLQKDIDTRTLQRFYTSVRNNVSNINSLHGKQQIIKDLYGEFFRAVFPRTVEKLGIVYTPVECVDFIINSVEALMHRHFNGASLSDSNVHILDPFVGTGTFITRLLQSDVIRPKDLERKYRYEIHCNEIVPLAYYIANVNIENTFHNRACTREYIPYNGIVLTDTFQLAEGTQRTIPGFFDENRAEIENQRKAPIRVIICNPPYSVGQKSANDNAQNQKYPALDQRIAETYAAESTATLKNSLYDSYIRAIRWATDRIDKQQGGIIGIISNKGWIDSMSSNGMRASLEKEFDEIYIYDLRGDQRTQGELSRKEGGKIFGSGSRTPIAMTFFVKRPLSQSVSNNGEGSIDLEGEVSPCASISASPQYAATPSGPLPRPNGHPLSMNGEGEFGPLPRPNGHPLSMNGEGECEAFRSFTATEPGELSAWNWGKTNKVTGGVKIDRDKLELAKQYRSNPTPKEAEVWEWVRAKRLLGLKWRRQQLIDGFIADFYCSELYLALEIDGNIHDSKQAQAYDEIRNQIFAAKGIRTLRVSNECTQEELIKCINTIISPSPFMEKGSGGEVANIHYYAVADYLSREEKLAQIREYKSIIPLGTDLSVNGERSEENVNLPLAIHGEGVGGRGLPLQTLIPDEHHDWLNQRDDSYQFFIPLECEKKFTAEAKNCVFEGLTNGVKTNRDAWCYNYSLSSLVKNIQYTISYYNSLKLQINDDCNMLSKIIPNPKAGCITVAWKQYLQNNENIVYNNNALYFSEYRPFTKQYLYYDKYLNERPGQSKRLFPTPQSENLIIGIAAPGGKKDFTCLMMNCIADLHAVGDVQCFPLYYYDTAEDAPKKPRGLFDGPIPQPPSPVGQGARHDGITDWILEKARKQYHHKVSPHGGDLEGAITKEDIFYYVYGILHSPKYRETFANDLKKSLPRIPLVEKAEDFWAFSRAGRELGALHVNYETGPMNTTVKVYIKDVLTSLTPSVAVGDISPSLSINGERSGENGISPSPFMERGPGGEVDKNNYIVKKMKFDKDKRILYYNSDIRIENIPREVDEYIVNGRSALGWLVDQYQVSTDKASGIVNDPNDWAQEHDAPRYILDLVLRIIELSVRTVKIVRGLPELAF